MILANELAPDPHTVFRNVMLPPPLVLPAGEDQVTWKHVFGGRKRTCGERLSLGTIDVGSGSRVLNRKPTGRRLLPATVPPWRYPPGRCRSRRSSRQPALRLNGCQTGWPAHEPAGFRTRLSAEAPLRHTCRGEPGRARACFG